MENSRDIIVVDAGVVARNSTRVDRLSGVRLRRLVVYRAYERRQKVREHIFFIINIQKCVERYGETKNGDALTLPRSRARWLRHKD